MPHPYALVLLTLTLLLATAPGCLQPNTAPEASQSEPAPPENEPILVNDPNPNPEPTLDDLIREYTQRIQQADTVDDRYAATTPPPQPDPQLPPSTDPTAATPPPSATTTDQSPENSTNSPTPKTATTPTETPADPPAVPTEPPVLVDVSVHARPAHLVKPQPTDANPAPNTPQQASHPDQPDDRLTPEQWARSILAEPPGHAFAAQLDHRVACVLVGDYERARQPLPLATDTQQTTATELIETLITIRESHLGDPTAAANAALPAVERLHNALRARSDLKIDALKLCQAVRGFGQYDEFNPPHFAVGHPVEFVVYVQITDFVSTRDPDGLFRSAFDLRTEILTSAGDQILKLDDPNIVDRCRTRRRDCFIPRLVTLPATLAPGGYVAKVTITDKLGKKVAEQRATFRVVANP